MSEETVVVTRSFEAGAERVFDAWVVPAVARKWLFATPTGERVRVEIDARVGGKFEIVERRDGVEVAHVGEYSVVERPGRLVFTFGVPLYSAVMTKMMVEIVAEGTGCVVTLTHEGVLPEWAERTREGWGKLLAGLEKALGVG